MSWKKITEFDIVITEELITRLSPETGVIRSALELVACEGAKKEDRVLKRRSTTIEEKEEELLPGLMPVPGSHVRLTSLPVHSFPLGASPADITRHSLDPTYMLDTMLSTLKRYLDCVYYHVHFIKSFLNTIDLPY